MKPEHFPSLDKCKKLTSLGFPKTEKVMLVDHKFPSPTIFDDTEDTLIGKGFGISGYVCPSVMEMMDVIPKMINSSDGRRISLKIRLYDEGNSLGYEWLDSIVYSKHGTVPNALADLIAWLVENSHLTFDKR